MVVVPCTTCRSGVLPTDADQPCCVLLQI